MLINTYMEKKKQNSWQRHSLKKQPVSIYYHVSNQANCYQLQLLLYQVGPLISDVSALSRDVGVDTLTGSIVRAAS